MGVLNKKRCKSSGNVTFASSSGTSITGNTLLVAGGGGGGGYDANHDGAGGGAGAVGVGNLTYNVNIKYAIIIGAGGTGGTGSSGLSNYSFPNIPRSGGNSYITGGSISELAYGGGFGNPCNMNGGGSGYGGSGGGGNSGWNINKPGLRGDPGLTMLKANGQTWSFADGASGVGTLRYLGNRGGYVNANLNHGGGGGAGGVGVDGTSTTGGPGGPGYTWLNGSTYGGGGGGAASGYNTNMYGGTGGSGGGAPGSNVTYADTNAPFNATPNTGGGGGGAHGTGTNRCSGGSGICIMAFLASQYTLQ